MSESHDNRALIIPASTDEIVHLLHRYCNLINQITTAIDHLTQAETTHAINDALEFLNLVIVREAQWIRRNSIDLSRPQNHEEN